MKNTNIHQLKNPDLKDVASITMKLKNETKNEHIYLVKGGKAFAWFEGDANSVNPPQEQLIRFKDALVLHNHPNGTSFSLEDIMAVLEYDIKEMRIITQQNSFIVKRPARGWNISFEDASVEKVYNEIFTDIDKKLEDLYSNGEINGKEKDVSINHLLWMRFFSNFGIRYKKY